MAKKRKASTSASKQKSATAKPTLPPVLPRSEFGADLPDSPLKQLMNLTQHAVSIILYVLEHKCDQETKRSFAAKYTAKCLKLAEFGSGIVGSLKHVSGPDRADFGSRFDSLCGQQRQAFTLVGRLASGAHAGARPRLPRSLQ